MYLLLSLWTFSEIWPSYKHLEDCPPQTWGHHLSRYEKHLVSKFSYNICPHWSHIICILEDSIQLDHAWLMMTNRELVFLCEQLSGLLLHTRLPAWPSGAAKKNLLGTWNMKKTKSLMETECKITVFFPSWIWIECLKKDSRKGIHKYTCKYWQRPTFPC